MAAPRSRALEKLEIFVAIDRQLELRGSGDATQVIDRFVFHYSHEPGAFRASSRMTVTGSDRPLRQAYAHYGFKNMLIVETISPQIVDVILCDFQRVVVQLQTEVQ